MGVKVATTVFHWSQPILPLSQSSRGSSSSSSSTRAVVLRREQRLHRSSFLGTTATTSRLHRSWSCCEFPKSKLPAIRRSCSASLDNSFSDEEFSKKIQELASRFQLADDAENSEPPSSSGGGGELAGNPSLQSETAGWGSAEEIIQASIERRANSVDLPVSLRMIKRKMRWPKEAGESAYCSVKKAFSSMVFIIRELHSFSLQMRELLFYEDLRGILETVQKEMHASFVWLFQQVFSHTPTLMVYVMILLANFTVYSMGHSPAIAAAASLPIAAVGDVTASAAKFDSSAVKTFSPWSSNPGGKKTTSVGGGPGGGGGARPVAGGEDGEGGVERSAEEELALWNSMVEEAAKMEGSFRDESLDRETVLSFVAPVNVTIESDKGYDEYTKTELRYQYEILQDPNNALLLVNYAQFLYLVLRDNDRAEEYFKRATKVRPVDPATFSKYATFLWKVRNNLWAAEEAFQEAIAADPSNTDYAADYAHFLWNTGGADTCFPLSGSPESRESNHGVDEDDDDDDGDDDVQHPDTQS